MFTIFCFFALLMALAAVSWPDKDIIMRFFTIFGKFIKWLAEEIRLEWLVYKANKNLRRRNK